MNNKRLLLAGAVVALALIVALGWMLTRKPAPVPAASAPVAAPADLGAVASDLKDLLAGYRQIIVLLADEKTLTDAQREAIAEIKRVYEAKAAEVEILNQDKLAGVWDPDARDLVLTSGGKDSVVTLELLRQAGRPFDCLLLNPSEAAFAVARQASLSKKSA